MDRRETDVGFACVSDARALAVMSRDLIEAGVGWAYRPGRMTTLIMDPDAVVLMARRGRQRVGFAVMSFSDARAHLALLAVCPTCRRRGIGAGLIEWLLESCHVAGVTAVDVELRADNGAAYELYRKLGFGETSRIAGYYAGRETAIRMLRLLPAQHAGMGEPWRPPTRDGPSATQGLR
ncbi:MAG: GNAT family N-acetyltransferase [Pseudomonadota bacterium]|nr:GNAT family N-acetyltransferase [Pseudomonadota bacterium]